MKNKIKSIVKKVPKETVLPDGLYTGTWGGYVIELTYKKEIYQLFTEIGVKGINIPVVVEVKENKITFDRINT